MGACHASELSYVFNNPKVEEFSGKVDADAAKKISRMWAQFARVGNPSIEGIAWSEYGSDFNTLVFNNDGTFGMQKDVLSEQRLIVKDLLGYSHIFNEY